MVAKRCCDCERPLHPRDFHRKKQASGNLWVQARCKECHRAADRYGQGMKHRGRPYDPRSKRMSREEELAVRREQYRRDRDKINAARRARHKQRMATDPEYAERHKRQQRESVQRRRDRERAKMER